CNDPFRLSTNALVFLAIWAGPRSTIRKIMRLAPAIRRFKNSMKTAALTPPCCLIMKRMWPREEIAEIRLMPDGRPWFQQWAFHLFCPRCGRRDDRTECARRRRNIYQHLVFEPFS